MCVEAKHFSWHSDRSQIFLAQLTKSSTFAAWKKKKNALHSHKWWESTLFTFTIQIFKLFRSQRMMFKHLKRQHEKFSTFSLWFMSYLANSIHSVHFYENNAHPWILLSSLIIHFFFTHTSRIKKNFWLLYDVINLHSIRLLEFLPYPSYGDLKKQS